MTIHIEHSNADQYHWDWFHVELKDDSKPDGRKITGSASGDWEFVSRTVSMWLIQYNPNNSKI